MMCPAAATRSILGCLKQAARHRLLTLVHRSLLALACMQRVHMAVYAHVTGSHALPACWLSCFANCQHGRTHSLCASCPCCAFLLTLSFCNSLMCMASTCRCVQNLPDACAENSSDCWKGDHKVNGQTMTFDACTDNIQAAKVGLLVVLGKRQRCPAAVLHAAGLPGLRAHLAERDVPVQSVLICP